MTSSQARVLKCDPQMNEHHTYPKDLKCSTMIFIINLPKIEVLSTSFDQRYLQELIVEFIKDFKGSWVYFHAFSNKFSCSMRSSSSILWSDIIFKSYMINHAQMWKKISRDASLTQGCWPNLASPWFYDHVSISPSILITLRWFFLLWTLLIILDNFSSQKDQILQGNPSKDARHYRSPCALRN